jgi:hypothetical protein
MGENLQKYIYKKIDFVRSQDAICASPSSFPPEVCMKALRAVFTLGSGSDHVIQDLPPEREFWQSETRQWY